MLLLYNAVFSLVPWHYPWEQTVPVANSVLGRFWEAARVRVCSASSRSAGVPCRSPFRSFLNAYDTVMAL